ncbi:hypothetical protein, partial [Thiobacillus sp.]
MEASGGDDEEDCRNGGCMSRELFKFKGGVHPPEHKAESTSRPIHAAPLPKKLVIPLRQ